MISSNNIIFEDKNFLIINKPAGIMVHGDGKSDNRSLADLVLEMRPEIKGIGEQLIINGKNIERSGVVHRLDTDTSGAIIFAKNNQAYNYLKEQFQNRKVEKEYHAFVWGHFKEVKGTINTAIGRSINNFRRFLAGRGTRGELREAVTDWEVVEQFEDEQGYKFSFVKLFPHTGRTHQLRVHMKYIQRPIISDDLYIPEKRKALGFDRVALHAANVSFLGLEGQRIAISAPYPADFDQALAHYLKK